MKKFISLLLISFLYLSISQTSYADSCNLTKTLYESGKYKRAFKHAKTYANYNNACAEYYLGLMYLNGYGVKMDSKKGNDYLQSAVNKGSQKAIDFLDSRPF